MALAAIARPSSAWASPCCGRLPLALAGARMSRRWPRPWHGSSSSGPGRCCRRRRAGARGRGSPRSGARARRGCGRPRSWRSRTGSSRWVSPQASSACWESCRCLADSRRVAGAEARASAAGRPWRGRRLRWRAAASRVAVGRRGRRRRGRRRGRRRSASVGVCRGPCCFFLAGVAVVFGFGLPPAASRVAAAAGEQRPRPRTATSSRPAGERAPSSAAPPARRRRRGGGRAPPRGGGRRRPGLRRARPASAAWRASPRSAGRRVERVVERALEPSPARGRPAVAPAPSRARAQHGVDRGAAGPGCARTRGRRRVLDVRARLGGEVLGLERPRRRSAARRRRRRARSGPRRRSPARPWPARARCRRRCRAPGRSPSAGPRARAAAIPKSAIAEALALVEQQVRRLDVAVDDAGVVRGVERRGGLAQPAQRRSSCGISRAGAQPVGHRAAAQQLHDHERAAVVLADVVDRDDVAGGRRARRRPAPRAGSAGGRASSSPRCEARTLTATARSSSSSWASQTLAIPPLARWRTTR